MLKSVRPYVVRDGRSYCASCGRRRLARIDGTSYVCCPDCDAGEEIRTGARDVIIGAGVLLCGTCGRNELVAAPRGGALECPRCDTPPWEHEQVGQPAVAQTSIAEVDELVAPDDRKGKADGPARPDSVVRTCFFCRQSCWQDYVWRQVKWVAVCRGCGNRLSTSRAKGARTKQRRDRGA